MVTDDPAQAGAWAAEGRDVVLVAIDGDGPAVRAARAGTGPGRVALLVGDPTDETVTAAAAAMDAELFGPRPPRRSP
ncbi:MAG: hypothetical protein ACYC1D_00090 [Acidimicrobiales bacterium]